MRELLEYQIIEKIAEFLEEQDLSINHGLSILDKTKDYLLESSKVTLK